MVVIILFFLGESCLYFYQYFFIWSQNYPQQLNVGFAQIVQTAEQKFTNQVKAVIDDEGYLYITTAWYSSMPATEFFTTHQKHLPDKIGLRYGYKVGSYRFIKSIDDRMEEERVVLSKKDGQWKILQIE
jgi:hypothetical protein